MAHELRPLILAAQAGDRRALEALAGCADRFVRIFSGTLSRQVRRTQGSTVDFVLEGLAGALARIEAFEYESDEHFYAWVTRAIRSRIADAWRHEARRKRAGRPQPLGEGELDAAAPGPTASGIISERELREEVGCAIVDIQVDHPLEMEVLVLKLFEGASWPEIRERLSLTSDRRARTLFARGVDLLRPRVSRLLGGMSFDGDSG